MKPFCDFGRTRRELHINKQVYSTSAVLAFPAFLRLSVPILIIESLDQLLLYRIKGRVADDPPA